MPTVTPNYNLTKPSYTDPRDVTVLNANADIIDAALKAISDAVGGALTNAQLTALIANDLIQTTIGKILDARQGKVLSDMIALRLLKTDVVNSLADTSTEKAAAAATVKTLNDAKAAKVVEVTGTLTAAGWTGTSAPFSQTLTITGMTAALVGVAAGLTGTATDAQYTVALAAQLRATAQGTNTVTFKSLGAKPTIDLPVLVRITG